MYCDKKIVLFIFILLLSGSLFAQPDFSKKMEIENVRCFLDANKPNIAYYTPGKLSIAADRDGKPDFNFLQTRYTGTAAYGDQYSFRFKSILRFRVVMQRLSAEQLSTIKKKLWPAGGTVRLLPLPITNIKTNIIFVGIEENTDTTQFSGGLFSAENKDGLNQKGVYWKEREFALRLDDQTSEALWSTLLKGQSLMSLSYAFFSKGVNTLESEFTSEGEKEVLDKLKEQIEETGDSLYTEQICVLADAFSIRIDSEKWPNLLSKVDINEQVPPSYAALEVRCYDFNNQLRPDLLAKRIEIKAKGIGRGDVIVKANFSPKDPDIYAYNIKFPYAIQLEQPLYYRVTSIGNETAPEKTEWIERQQWAGIIDITSSEDEIILPDENEEY